MVIKDLGSKPEIKAYFSFYALLYCLTLHVHASHLLISWIRTFNTVKIETFLKTYRIFKINYE